MLKDYSIFFLDAANLEYFYVILFFQKNITNLTFRANIVANKLSNN